MDASSHMFVFVSLILGLALGRILSGFAQLYSDRQQVVWNAAHCLWGAVLILACIGDWWGLWSTWRDMSSYEPVQFMFIIARPLVLFGAAALLFPEREPSGKVNLWDRYWSARRVFLPLVMIALTIDVVAPLVKQSGSDSIYGQSPCDLAVGLAIQGVFLLLVGAGLWVRAHAYHVVAPLILILVTLPAFFG